MAKSICFACGATKTSIAGACRRCGISPRGDAAALAKSLYLSIDRFDDPDDSRVTRTSWTLSETGLGGTSLSNSTRASSDGWMSEFGCCRPSLRSSGSRCSFASFCQECYFSRPSPVFCSSSGIFLGTECNGSVHGIIITVQRSSLVNGCGGFRGICGFAKAKSRVGAAAALRSLKIRAAARPAALGAAWGWMPETGSLSGSAERDDRQVPAAAVMRRFRGPAVRRACREAVPKGW